MRNPRVYQPIDASVGETLPLESHAAKHLVQVLRMRPGDPFILFNGRGQAWQARLSDTDRREVTALILESISESAESPLHVHLGLGISKGDRMDYAIQKAVELGVGAITPLFTRYSMIKLNAQRQDKRRQHWQGIIVSACEQCGRNQLPLLHPAKQPEEWLDSLHTEQKLLLDPTAAQPLGALSASPRSTALYIGPEGGLSEEEIASARQKGFSAIRLGPRVLRTETAVVAALTAVQVVWGDLH